MDPTVATLPLHAGGSGLIVELVGGIVGGLVTAVGLFYAVRHLAAEESSDQPGEDFGEPW